MKKSFILIILSSITLSSCSFEIGKKSSNFDVTSEEPISSSNEPVSSEIISSSGLEEFKGYAPEGYSIYWQDEFSSSRLGSHWEAMHGDGSDYGVYRWGNNEDQFYTEHNFYLKDGALHIFAQKERMVTENHTYEVTSARLRTKGQVTTTYGYIESRIKLPAGTGLWPAFWMLPESNFQDMWWPTSGEIDIMEARGRLPDVYGATLHSGSTRNADVYYNKDYTFTDSDITEYHCYAVEWTVEGFKFMIDGYMFHEVKPSQYQNGNPLYTESSSNAPFDQPFHLLLNLAVGGNYDNGKTVGDDFVEAEMLVDYVRIYHKD